jgi:hypothetical protein
MTIRKPIGATYISQVIAGLPFPYAQQQVNTAFLAMADGMISRANNPAWGANKPRGFLVWDTSCGCLL